MLNYIIDVFCRIVWQYRKLIVSLPPNSNKTSSMEKVKRTKEEVRAAYREALRKKQEWIEESNKRFEMIRSGELKIEYV